MEIANLAGLALSTLISEDLASLGAGLLIRNGTLPTWEAVTACVIGVYLGDLGLWCTGRVLGRRVVALPGLRTRLHADRLGAIYTAVDTRLGATVMLSRFLPGSRDDLDSSACRCDCLVW